MLFVWWGVIFQTSSEKFGETCWLSQWMNCGSEKLAGLLTHNGLGNRFFWWHRLTPTTCWTPTKGLQAKILQDTQTAKMIVKIFAFCLLGAVVASSSSSSESSSESGSREDFRWFIIHNIDHIWEKDILFEENGREQWICQILFDIRGTKPGWHSLTLKLGQMSVSVLDT